MYTDWVFFSCLGDRLSDFYVGVTDFSPHDVPPHPHPPSYKVCLHYRVAFNQRATETIECSFPVSGRYIIIQLLTAGTPLSLCEVEVYTGKRLHVSGKHSPCLLFVASFKHYSDVWIFCVHFDSIYDCFVTKLQRVKKRFTLKSNWQKSNEIKFVGEVKFFKPRSHIAIFKSLLLHGRSHKLVANRKSQLLGRLSPPPPRWLKVTFYALNDIFSSNIGLEYTKCSHEAHDC